MKKLLTYISLFSSAGVGCYGFKEEGFDCIATNELLEKRLNIQRYNKKCKYPSGYVLGDIQETNVKNQIYEELKFWKYTHGIKKVDVIIATPPCQGISVANHKKKQNEQDRNSLVIESLKIIKEILPNFFLIENVRNFLGTICTDIDGTNRSIKEAIDIHLSENFNILESVINFKDYGSSSSRTRTIVIGVNKELKKVTPFDLFPESTDEKTLEEVIGHLPSLTKMGEFNDQDLLHNFKEYDIKMLPWIENLNEGESAFDNKDPLKIPHQIKNGVIVYNKNKNGDKYKRQNWNKIAPCIHTRNDILSSQNTIHPRDNRVFSIRELMILMSIPKNFKWFDKDYNFLNGLSLEDKKTLMKKHEMNIRASIGEAVPTIVFTQIAKKIKNYYNRTNPTLNTNRYVKEDHIL